MKVIEFINKVYNEDIQKLKVRIKEKYYFYEKGEDYFKRIDNRFLVYCLDFNRLDDEIEIIEEEKKIELPDKLMQLDTRETQDCTIAIQDKINEIIDYLKAKEEREDKE